ncbi:siderophore-interacting protein [Nocardioides sp.]|uniref:siderophore-interacting protein n=1 Tax=Nocardioides sp. TaxID=35761 RepID=UPI0027174746|nr:siderophore-interacting protein [Nocardioides sp.]MDO9457315.1 siderophore-interacting protein [Nocardioides sp.]
MYGEVVSTQVLTPQLIRVVLGGTGLDGIAAPGGTDSYVNAFFVPEGAPYDVPFEDDAVRDLPREQRPYPRRYTVRSWDEAQQQLTLDFVVHGDVGRAGRWAQHAQPGDRLQFRGPAGGWVPEPEADSYLLVGDESALPAIAGSAELVPAGRPVVAVVEVEDAAGEVPITSPGDLTVVWVHRAGAGGPVEDLLPAAVAALAPLPGTVSAFVHGEAVATRAVRRHLLEQGVVDRGHLSCSPYWRRGHDDEEWRAVKGAWTREVEADVP